MKSLLFLLLSTVIGCAQVPSFKSFTTNRFTTNNFVIDLKDPLVVTNLTVISNLVSQTIYTTNLYATNLYVTNIYQDITFDGRVTFNTNVTFTTNIYGNAMWPAHDIQFLRSQGAYKTNFYVSNVTDTNDVITVAAGKKIMITSATVGTTNGIVTTIGGLLKTGGDYYRFNTANVTTNSPNTGSIFGASTSYLFEEGDTIAVAASLPGANFFLSGWVFGTNVPFRTVRVLSLSGGIDTLYTVPASTAAYSLSVGMLTGSIATPLTYRNDSGAARLLTLYIVPSGSSADSTTFVYSTSVNNTIGFTSSAITPYLRSGDTIQISSDDATATQWAYTTVYEVPE